MAGLIYLLAVLWGIFGSFWFGKRLALGLRFGASVILPRALLGVSLGGVFGILALNVCVGIGVFGAMLFDKFMKG